MGAIQIHNKNEGLVPKPRRGKEVQKIAEKAVNTVDIKGKETSGAYDYKGHCMLLVSPDQKEKSLTLSLFVFTGETNSFYLPDSSNYNADSQTSKRMANTKISLQKTSQRLATLRST